MAKKTGSPQGTKLLCQLHWYHWVVLAASLALTLTAWYFTKTQVEEKNRIIFDREVNQTLELILERLQKYENVLWSAAGLFNASEKVTLSEWRIFSQTVSIDKKFPGINGIGVAHYIQPEKLTAYLEEQKQQRPNFYIHPKHKENIHIPISYIEPETINRAAIGLDLAHEEHRYRAALKAWNTNTAQITGPITLVQDEEQTPGFLFLVPVYKNKDLVNKESDVSQRDALIYAPFVMKKLMLGTLSKEVRHIGVTIKDNNIVLYDENIESQKNYDPKPLMETMLSKEMYGRTWNYTFRSDLNFRLLSNNNQPTTILISGLIIDALLLLLFLFLARSQKKAINYADEVTKDLQEKATRLKKSNEELERFAYVASHDLKAPLRGIDNLIGWIEEDSRDVLSYESKDYIKKIKNRIKRMNGLIEGILDYSRVGINQNRKHEVIDVSKILADLKEQYEQNPNVHIQLIGDFPMLKGSNVHFKQVAENLISNAIKYNDKSITLLDITYHEEDGQNTFIFKDNGPGIDQMFHTKIFELFQTLHPKDEYESTGVGLAIVKKIIEQNGGQIWVTSQLSKETQFHFSWSNSGDTSHGE